MCNVGGTAPSGLKLSTREQGAIFVVDLEGDLDSRSAWTVKEQIKTAIESGKSRRPINLEGVHYMDSAGLGTLVSALKVSKEHGGNIYLAGLTDQVRMVIELTRLNRVFVIFDSSDQALMSLEDPNFRDPAE